MCTPLPWTRQTPKLVYLMQELNKPGTPLQAMAFALYRLHVQQQLSMT